MSQRYRKVYEREEVRHAAIAPRDRLVPDAGNGIPALFGANALFPEEAGGSGSVGGFSTLFRGGALATVADKAALLGATQRRPEEQRFCEAFVGLKGKVVSKALLISFSSVAVTRVVDAARWFHGTFDTQVLSRMRCCVARRVIPSS